MIKTFAHKGLAEFYAIGSRAGIIPSHARRLGDQLAALDTATQIGDMSVPGWRLHQLTGDQAGRWSITVRANWRITFEFRGGDAYIVDYEDYH